MKDVVGAKIQEVNKIYDYWQIKTDICDINIYNKFRVYGLSKDIITIEDIKKHLNSTFITRVHYNENKIYSLWLSNEITLEVSLEAEAYIGPEAIEIYYFSGDVIIIG